MFVWHGSVRHTKVIAPVILADQDNGVTPDQVVKWIMPDRLSPPSVEHREHITGMYAIRQDGGSRQWDQRSRAA